MNKYSEFIDLFSDMQDHLGDGWSDKIILTPGVAEVLEELKSRAEDIDNKPLFTDIGLQILEYMQTANSKQKAKDIADGMGVSSRKVSGAIRKLVTDKFVEKYGQNPVVYNLTEQGKQFNIKDYKEKVNNA